VLESERKGAPLQLVVVDIDEDPAERDQLMEAIREVAIARHQHHVSLHIKCQPDQFFLVTPHGGGGFIPTIEFLYPQSDLDDRQTRDMRDVQAHMISSQNNKHLQELDEARQAIRNELAGFARDTSRGNREGYLQAMAELDNLLGYTVKPESSMKPFEEERIAYTSGLEKKKEEEKTENDSNELSEMRKQDERHAQEMDQMKHMFRSQLLSMAKLGSEMKGNDGLYVQLMEELDTMLGAIDKK